MSDDDDIIGRVLSSDSSDDDSDDDYLTGGGGRTGDAGKQRGGGGVEDREAIIRRKLLESFYGATSPQVAAADNEAAAAAQQEEEEEDDDNNASSMVAAALLGSDERTAQVQDPMTYTPTSEEINLDSSSFNTQIYTTNLIRSSNTEALLKQSNQFSTEIKSLDSTMQTLVYENYSKFIDATDAIRSIGRSVDASEAGLNRLRVGMERISNGTRTVEEALKESREKVAEKLRVRRLLHRLDALLKLPATLRRLIGEGG
eukprot:CAMPEP_0194355912 /NCGR_PEP_ID=MMETSP0174-20130528/3764_1 /TAXON_ID=216777 /ORGANISM="Proboscia alata, Strain PI-D3" /LENGTH=257 /DNA_ID=CAMNT_0039125385 /DNA_START=28 /DNA_END=798 /DNA_ORIENTATION=+